MDGWIEIWYQRVAGWIESLESQLSSLHFRYDASGTAGILAIDLFAVAGCAQKTVDNNDNNGKNDNNITHVADTAQTAVCTANLQQIDTGCCL